MTVLWSLTFLLAFGPKYYSHKHIWKVKTLLSLGFSADTFHPPRINPDVLKWWVLSLFYLHMSKTANKKNKKNTVGSIKCQSLMVQFLWNVVSTHDSQRINFISKWLLKHSLGQLLVHEKKSIKLLTSSTSLASDLHSPKMLNLNLFAVFWVSIYNHYCTSCSQEDEPYSFWALLDVSIYITCRRSYRHGTHNVY